MPKSFDLPPEIVRLSLLELKAPLPTKFTSFIARNAKFYVDFFSAAQINEQWSQIAFEMWWK